MRRHLLALCVAGVLVGSAFAQEKAERRKREGAAEGTPRARGERPARGQERTAQLLAELKLTEKQEAPVKQIFETRRQEMATWLQQNGPAMLELMGKLRGGRGREGAEGGEAAKTPTDEERKAAAEKLREIQKQRAQIDENLLKQLKDHLTEEQMAIVRKQLGQRAGQTAVPGLRALAQLGLDDAQRQKVREILSASRESAKDKDAAGKAEASKEAWAKIEKDVLTDEQRKKFQEIQSQGPDVGGRGGSAGMFSGLDLTDEQKTRLQDIQAEMRKKSSEADTPEARREAMRAAREKMNEVLTPEQREKLRQGRGAAPDRRGGRGTRPNPESPVVVD